MSLPPNSSQQDIIGDSPIRTLVAEDNDDLRLLLTLRLRMLGMEVTSVINGEEAVEQVRAAGDLARPFDLILMDMEMPILDGFEATRQLRALGHLGPIFAMTAHDPGGMIDCGRFGCDGYVTKPIDWDKLAATLRESVAHSRGSSAPRTDV